MLTRDFATSRRRFLRGLGALSALVSTPILSSCRTTRLEGSSLKDDELPDDPDAFLSMSSMLTGFDELDTSLAPKFHAELKAHHGAKANQLVAAFKAIDPNAQDFEAQVTQKIISEPALGPVAAAAISLWYVGTFSKTTVPEPIGVKAYRNSLVYKVVTNGKPMGVPEEEESAWSAPLADG